MKDIIKFEDLVFKPHPIAEGEQSVVFFENGYGASIINSEICYCDEDKPYEIAVLELVPDGFSLCYDTPITDDVIGYLTENDVSEILEQIQKLPEGKGAKYYDSEKNNKFNR
jgi:hypothetical protein